MLRWPGWGHAQQVLLYTVAVSRLYGYSLHGIRSQPPWHTVTSSTGLGPAQQVAAYQPMLCCLPLHAPPSTTHLGVTVM